jgi:hypothetical protein
MLLADEDSQLGGNKTHPSSVVFRSKYFLFAAGVESRCFTGWKLIRSDEIFKLDSRNGDFMADPNNSTAQVAPRPDPNEQLVRVFESEEETEAMVVKGLLESAGIDSDLAPLALTQQAFPSMGGTIILVREEDAETARRVIAENKRPEVAEDFDDDATEELPQQK